MSSEEDSKLHAHLNSILKPSSRSPISLSEARPPSSSGPQPPNIANDQSLEPMSIKEEEAHPSPVYIQGWKLHMLTLG